MARSAKNEHAFYMLGGKLESGETDEESLDREIEEEAGCKIKEGSLQFLKSFQAPAFGRSDLLITERVYIGELEGEPTPSSEVAELRYFDSTIEEKHLTPLSRLIIGWLHGHGYIK